ncbi:BspA family leucine-rich repeat surface protein [Campylobacter jejuni]|uniref:BspA family leucine-rich repeat surface protein n=1 Tax=Campylobacter jejuni TaxID=197 RepID=UPI003B9AC14B
MAKFTPETKEELQALVKDQSIYLGDIDTSKITDMSCLFSWTTRKDFSGIEKWDVSNVENMAHMFAGCKTFNQDISSWDVSKVKDMECMLHGCHVFNQDISKWDTSKVTTMEGMFWGCESFDQPLGDWDVSRVETMESMFARCYSFNQDISKWDVSRVENMYSMFHCCSSFNQDISGWDVSGVENMRGMFDNCKTFNQDISGWDVSSVKNMGAMFAGCKSFNQDLSSWNVSNVESMFSMFKGCTSFNQPLNDWDVSRVKNMEDMFENCPIDNSNKPDVLQNEIFTKAFRFTDEGDLVITLTPDFECFLAENQIKNSQDFADKFSDTLDENRYFDIPRILCYKEDLKSTPFEDFDNEYFVFVPNDTNIDLDSLSYAVSVLNPSIQKDFLIEAMKTKIEEGEINKENLKENLENEIKYISEQIPIVFEGKVGEDTIEKLLKEKETIVLPNVTKYAKNSINEYFENEKVEILEELKKHFNHSYKNK